MRTARRTRTARPSATTATSAGNADTLDALDSTAFARRACDRPTGAIKGVVTIDASPTFPATLTAVAGYNCTGQTIEASRVGMGPV
jgi:hypothetical protein